MVNKLIFKLTIITLCACSCVPGYLYTNTVAPLDRNMNSTRIGDKEVIISTHRLKEPITGYNVSAEWKSRAIGDAAKKGNLSKIYFADMKTLSILGGIYKKQSVLIYGTEQKNNERNIQF